MNIDVPNIDDVASAKGAPAFRNPVLGNESVNKNVEMGYSAFLKFQNSDVLDRPTEPAAKIETKLVEHAAQIRY